MNAASKMVLLSILVLLFCGAAYGQPGTGTQPSPPAHLPPLLGECESGPNYNACSVWIWHGSSYSAIWSNGATGQMTVSSGDAADLNVNRTDTSGTFAGLTAVYTGHWTGSGVSNAKMSFHIKTLSGDITWTASRMETPVLRNPDPNSSNYVNWYTAPLSAIAVSGSARMMTSKFTQDAPGTMLNDFRSRGEIPMNPGESRAFTLRTVHVPPDYEKGANYQQSEAIAAIYTDGTTFGDSHVLKALLERRRQMIGALTSIGSTICQLAVRQATMQEIGAALDKQHAEEDAKSPADQEGRGDAYYLVGKSMVGRDVNRMAPAQAEKHVWEQVNKWRSDLASDPVKDGSGQLAVPAVTPLQCSLP